MAIADGNSLPAAVCEANASPHEVTLVDETLKSRFTTEIMSTPPIGDRAYDSDPLDEKLKAEHGIEMVAPHKKTESKRPCEAKKCWKAAGGAKAWSSCLPGCRTFGGWWMTWYERHSDNFLGMAQRMHHPDAQKFMRWALVIYLALGHKYGFGHWSDPAPAKPATTRQAAGALTWHIVLTEGLSMPSMVAFVALLSTLTGSRGAAVGLSFGAVVIGGIVTTVASSQKMGSLPNLPASIGFGPFHR